jgi:Arc/MetJ family transcription regulator
MRLHISLDDELVQELDRRVGRRQRSAFISSALRRALDDERRRESLEAAFGSIADTGHEWDDNPAEWVRNQRRLDPRRIG